MQVIHHAVRRAGRAQEDGRRVRAGDPTRRGGPVGGAHLRHDDGRSGGAEAWLRERHVERVALETAGVYWWPVFNDPGGGGQAVALVNPQHVKAVPGRKTDVMDAEWLVELLRHGLLRQASSRRRRSANCASSALPQGAGARAHPGGQPAAESAGERQPQAAPRSRPTSWGSAGGTMLEATHARADDDPTRAGGTWPSGRAAGEAPGAARRPWRGGRGLHRVLLGPILEPRGLSWRARWRPWMSRSSGRWLHSLRRWRCWRRSPA